MARLGHTDMDRYHSLRRRPRHIGVGKATRAAQTLCRSALAGARRNCCHIPHRLCLGASPGTLRLPAAAFGDAAAGSADCGLGRQHISLGSHRMGHLLHCLGSAMARAHQLRMATDGAVGGKRRSILSPQPQRTATSDTGAARRCRIHRHLQGGHCACSHRHPDSDAACTTRCGQEHARLHRTIKAVHDQGGRKIAADAEQYTHGKALNLCTRA